MCVEWIAGKSRHKTAQFVHVHEVIIGVTILENMEILLQVQLPSVPH